MSTPKTCSTCAHRNRSKCEVTGYLAEVERKLPSQCDTNFSRWIPRPGLFQRVKAYFLGWGEQ